MTAGQRHLGIAIGGFMGAGKSAIGARLAGRLGLPFVDTDAELIARFGPIAEQFEREGEAVFRARERAVIAEVCEGIPKVIAVGGGAWVDPENRERLSRAARTVMLCAPLEILADRVGQGEDRPLWDEGIARRLRSRQPAYSEAEIHVDVSQGSVGEAVEAVIEALQAPDRLEQRVWVDLGPRSYPVHIAPGGLRGLGPALKATLGCARVVVVTDSTVGPLWGAALRRSLDRVGIEGPMIAIPAGEPHKTLTTWAALVDRLLALGLDRRTPLVALGGGVTGDLVGFAAATALRGVPLVQVPTTLLSMVDSSVGGKTAVNHSLGKNLVGAFHQPSLVYAALHTLTTLDPAERIAGLGEVVKTALLGDPSLFSTLEEQADRLRRGERGALGPVIARCVEIKAQVVAEDERESGWRAVLNAGHTVGHGLETALGHGVIRHGEAVAWGLLREARWAEAAGICEEAGLSDRLERLLRRLGLLAALPEVVPERVWAAMGLDKKASGDMLVLPVPRGVGQMTLVNLPQDELSQLYPEPG